MSGNGESNMYWRYQAIWEEVVPEGEKLFSMIEVYLEDGKLVAWTEPTRPAGESWEELQSDLRRSHSGCSTYRPVAYEDLEVGMEFEREHE